MRLRLRAHDAHAMTNRLVRRLVARSRETSGSSEAAYPLAPAHGDAVELVSIKLAQLAASSCPGRARCRQAKRLEVREKNQPTVTAYRGQVSGEWLDPQEILKLCVVEEGGDEGAGNGTSSKKA